MFGGTKMAELFALHSSLAATFTVLLTAAAADDEGLLKRAREIFQPLPKDMATAEFPITRERVELGRSLFFDPRLTIDANMSCSSCHQPALYGTDALPKPTGVRQRPHPRHVPTNLNAGTSFVIHWRGDRTNFEDQVFQALTSPITSGQPDEKAVIDRLARIPGYAPLFKAAFPDEPQPMTLRNIAKAVGAYERTLVTPSPFDAYLFGNEEALPPASRDRVGSSTRVVWRATTASASAAGCIRNSAWWKIIGERQGAILSTRVASTSQRIPTTSTCSVS
jgi:cytochrome c peroxidase